MFGEKTVKSLDNGAKDHASDACHSLNHVIWHPMQIHLPSLRNEIVVHLRNGKIKECKRKAAGGLESSV
jgi:hypothetical protein